MSKIFKILAVHVLVLLSAPRVRADGVLMSWSPQTLDGASQASFDEAKGLPVEEILKRNETAESWPAVYHLALAANEHKNDKVFLGKLADELADGSERKLTHTTRLIIWERITSGDILFEGKGLQVSDDLFSVAGRANWLLRTVTSKKFGYVRPHCQPADLKLLQNRWRAWLAGQDTAEVADRYPTAVRGLEEIRSLEALEALIGSLRPGKAKTEITRRCLATLYHLDELPADAANPARLCSPDTYTSGYLLELTDVQEEHDASWWTAWWAAQHEKLTWDGEAGKFHLREPGKPIS